MPKVRAFALEATPWWAGPLVSLSTGIGASLSRKARQHKFRGEFQPKGKIPLLTSSVMRHPPGLMMQRRLRWCSRQVLYVAANIRLGRV
jgi:hypothetical protein